MELPEIITRSNLWARLEPELQLSAAIETLREKAASLAATIAGKLPGFTDHSLRHMDGLWAVADQVLTAEEAERVTPAEAFLLSAAFYLHDLGMALAATEEGFRRVERSAPYTQFIARMKASCSSDEEWAALAPAMERRALSVAVRRLHAEVAPQLATQPVPDTEIFLLEPRALREAWGGHIGKIAASHHWSLDRVDAEFGRKGIVPMPVGGADLAYIACLLRIIDYAHINRDRAPTIERALRQDMPAESLLHWLAQQNIDGPICEGHELVYQSSAPIGDVDAWWLYYSMLSGLDGEIRAVRRYLDRRSSKESRLSLVSVRGAASPEDCATFVETDGFIPIEVNIRAASIERLVRILGGESLYGANKVVPVRELIQNARDALDLKAATAESEIERNASDLPIEVFLRSNPEATFEIVDHGVGMSRKVMQDYLVAIASDYWNSEQFYSDFPGARERGFSPAGKFGIGFLSVFMVSDDVEVSSNRDGQERLQLSLRGVGRRGEIRQIARPTGSGTSVKLKLRPDALEALKHLEGTIRNLAPMLGRPVKVDVDGQTSEIDPTWWQHESHADFIDSVMQALQFVVNLAPDRPHAFSWGDRFWPSRPRDEIDKSPWPLEWPEWRGSSRRVLAHPYIGSGGSVVLCLRGIAVSTLRLPGFVGLINLDSATPDASRTSFIGLDRDAILRDARRAVQDSVLRNLDKIGESGFIGPKWRDIASWVGLYGEEVVRGSSIRWLSIVKPPGEVEMISCSDFLSRAAPAKRVRLSVGTGPWTSMKRWARENRRSEGDVELVLDDDPTAHIPYKDEEISGSLEDLWPDRGHGWHGARGATFPLVLSLVSEAWQTPASEMLKSSVWARTAGSLFGELTRPT